MEVHKHPHDITHKKKWSEYLLEFFMLFLAVFLGFIAENLREHYVEVQREKQFAKQLLVEIKGDAESYIYNAKNLEDYIQKHNKFSTLMTAPKPPTNSEVISSFYKLLFTHQVIMTSVTYSQMKSSGNLRYIHNQELISALQEYYEIYQNRLQIQNERNESYYFRYLEPFLLNHFLTTETDELGDSVTVSNPIFINRSRETDIQLTNIMNTFKLYLDVTLNRTLKPIIPKANNLIELLKKEYHLK